MADVNEKQAARESDGFSNPAGASAAVLADPFNRKVEEPSGRPCHLEAPDALERGV